MQKYPLTKMGRYTISMEMLSPVDRKKLDFYAFWVALDSGHLMRRLLDDYNFIRQFALPKYKNYSEFAFDQLFKASEELVRANKYGVLASIECKPTDVHSLKKTRHNETSLSEPFDMDQISSLLFGYLFKSALLPEYLKIDVDSKYPPECYPNKREWKDFEAIADFFGRLRWVLYLKNMIDAGSFNEPAELTMPKRTIPDLVIQYIWEGKIITNQNKDQYASALSSAGIISLKNGNKLYNDFCFYNQKCHRIADQAGDNKNRNHLNRMIIAYKNLRDEKAKSVAENEVQTFKKNAQEISGTIL